MTTPHEVSAAVSAYVIQPRTSDSDAVSFAYWVWRRWMNEPVFSAVMLTEWQAFIAAGAPAYTGSNFNGLTWAQIKAL